MPSVKTSAQNRASWQRRRAKNLERAMEMPRVPCECGCGTMILALTVTGRRRRYAEGHGPRRTPARPVGPSFPEFSQPGRCSEPWVDPEWFWADSTDPDMQGEAKRICFTCPIRLECDQWATDHGEPGIWGGLTREQRTERRARQRRAAA